MIEPATITSGIVNPLESSFFLVLVGEILISPFPYGATASGLTPDEVETDVIVGTPNVGNDEPPDNKLTVPVGVTITMFAFAFVGLEHETLQT